MSSSSSSRRNSKSQDPEPESPLSDRSPRQREPTSKKKSAPGAVLSPKTPLPLPNSSEAPKSTPRTAIPPTVDSSMDSYRTAQESMLNSSAGSTMSPIRIEADGYRSANSTARALFSQQGAAPLTRRPSRARLAPVSVPVTCQLVTPLAVHTAQEVNAVSATGQILVISQTLVRSAHASTNVRNLMNHLARTQPLISNEKSQLDIDHDNEHSVHKVFVGSDAILIQRVSTIHRGRDRNSFETDDRRTYRFICQGDLLPEDRRDKQSKPRHLTIVAESATFKDCEEIEKSERVMLVFDATDKPSRVLASMPAETSLTHVDDLSSKPSVLKDSLVTFEELVRVSDHSHINIVRRVRVNSCARLWDEPLTELKEQRVYKQQLADAADCEPVCITRSHSMSRVPTRDRSMSASRRAESPCRVERGRTPGRSSRNVSVLRPLSPIANERSRRAIDQPRPDFTPSVPTDLVTCISPIKDDPARRECYTARSASRSPAKLLSPTPTLRSKPRTPANTIPVIRTIEDEQPVRPMCSPSPAAQQRCPLTPLRTARVQSPRTPTRPADIVEEDTSAGSSQSPTRNRTPTTVSPRRTRLTTAVYQSPRRRRRTTSRNASMDGWERMLDTTQPISPLSPAPVRRMPDFPPIAAAARPLRHSRPLSRARSCSNLDSAGRPVQQLQQEHAAPPRYPLRRAVSEHSVLHPNSAIAMAAPFRRQLYVRQQPAVAAAAAAPAAAPVPRIPRTTRPSIAPVALSASGSATRQQQRPTAAASGLGPTAAGPPMVRTAEFTMPRTVVGKQRTGPGAPTQKNVVLVHNPEDFDEGEILKKQLTLDCKINGHLWALSVTFALRGERADLIRFAPKRVRIDDQTLWEETENWSETSLTPVTGPRTVARGSTSYDEVQLPADMPSNSSSAASTQTPSSSMSQMVVRVAPKNIATASTASSGSSRSKSAEKTKRVASKKSNSGNSKRGEKKQPESL